MADNVAITAGTGTSIATDDVSGVQYQKVKIDVGGDGVSLMLGNANPLPVSDAGGSLTVDGTVGISGTVPVSGTFYQATQPVSAASLPLPTGAATSAKQAAPGTAGTPSADVLTVQGVTSMTALKVDGSAVTQPVSASALPLPSGASTETTLAAANTALGSQSDAAATGNGSIIGLLKQLRALLSTTLTIAGTVTANVANATLAAGTALIGQVISAPQTGAIYSGTTALTPKFAAISASASGANTLVALVAGKKIRVLSVSLVANAAVNAKFQSAATPTDITGLYYLAANGGFVLPFSPAGHFETVAGEALSLNLSSAVAVGGVLTYVEV